MQDRSDAQLLRDFAADGDESAFREIVTRHTDLVYSAALRQVESPDLARDISQSVFVDLARKAKSVSNKLSADASLVGWLYRSTRFAALNHLRDTRRRAAHERLAMEQLFANSESVPDWERIRPVLEEVMSSLNDDDREALLLRFFKNQDFRAVGAALGVSDDAAQKRVSRAVDRLRELFAKRGVSVGAGGLAAVLAANSVQAAPAGMAAAISTAALAAGVTTTAAVAATTKVIAMTTLQKVAVAATLTLVAGAGIFEARQASRLREQNQLLQQRQAPLAAQVAQLEAENVRLSNQVAGMEDQQSLTRAQRSELLRLRGQTSQTRSALQELAKLKSAPPQNGAMPAYNALFTNAMAQGLSMSEKMQKKAALAELDRMTEQLHLTDSQYQAISNIMIKNIEDRTPLLMDAILGKQTLTPDQLGALAPGNEEAQIKAQLAADQLAAYPDFMQAEAATLADNNAKRELATMSGEMDLSQEQQDKIHSVLYQMSLGQATTSQDKSAAVLATANGNYADFLNSEFDKEKQHLADKVNALSGILTPDQLKTYQQKQQELLDAEAGAVKMFLPQTNSAGAQ